MDLGHYDFNQESRRFLERIEQDYEYEINLVIKELGPAEHGFSKVEGGVPTIEISVNEANVEELILHEAYHLRLRYDGMPSIGFDLPAGTNTESNRIYLDWFAHLFWDKVNHHYFYAKMLRDLNVDPYASLKRELDGIFQENEIKNLEDATKEIALAGYYLQTWVETQDSDYVTKFSAFLKERYDGLGIDKGEHLVELFKGQRLDSYDDCISLFVKVFDFMHRDQDIRIKGQRHDSESQQGYVQQMVWFQIGSRDDL